MATLLTESILFSICQRRSAGESLKAMAAELGITWQKLEKAIRLGLPGRRAENKMPYWQQRERAKERRTIKRKLAVLGVTFDRDETSIEALQALLEKATQAKSGPLTEKYRPRKLDDLFGQDKAVRLLRSFLAVPFSSAFVFEGETGTGKTSAAMVLAAELGCDLSQNPPEFGGLHVIASGEQTADTVRDIHEQLCRCPFFGSGWKVLIVNEADRMSAAAETIWLDRLESLPPKTAIVFTTNNPEKLSQRFRDRCTRVAFEADVSGIAHSARKLVASIWKRETGNTVPPEIVSDVVKRATEAGKISFRRVVQILSTTIQMNHKGAAQ